eukprot:339881_1
MIVISNFNFTFIGDTSSNVFASLTKEANFAFRSMILYFRPPFRKRGSFLVRFFRFKFIPVPTCGDENRDMFNRPPTFCLRKSPTFDLSSLALLELVLVLDGKEKRLLWLWVLGV